MSTIKLRRSGIAGKIPTTTQLDLGEVALNTYDGRLYIKKSVNSVESIVGIYGMPTTEETITVDAFTGDGSTTQYTLSRIPKADQYAYVSLNGVRQHITEYSLNGNVLTFNEAPEVDDVIEIRIHDVTPNHVVVRDYQKYVYTANDATIFDGADDNSLTLEYDVGFVEVYVNGSRLVDGSDFTATDGSSITIAESVTGTVEIVSLSRASFVDSQGGIPLTDSSALLPTAATPQVADTFHKLKYRTAKYIIQMTSGTDYHATEVLLIHDGTNVYMTEYGSMFTNVSLGDIDADISGNDVRLLVTPTSINTTVKTQRITVTV